MSYQVIARKWRPRNFDEVTGQEHITQALRNALEYGRLHHAYLFSGARGVGKTTTARLLAKSLNCHKTEKPNIFPCAPDAADACPSCIEIAESRSMDVLEIDAASHTGIDDVRDTIIENITVNPARDRYKVFIIDEVHQLSKPAFNALLKTLEEPPKNVVFIMATTELRKVPETITSRCQDFQFRTISRQKIFDRLKLIAESEKIDIDEDALREIARSGEGSMRDAQSNFDQVISFAGSHISASDVSDALGIASVEMLSRVAEAIAAGNTRSVLEVVAELTSRGQDLRSFCRDLMSFFRDLLIFKSTDNFTELLDDAMLGADELRRLGEPFSPSDLIRLFNSLAVTEAGLKEATRPRISLEMGLVRLVEMRRLAPLESIIERLARIEQSLSNGIGAERTSTEPGQMPTAAAEEKKTLKSEPVPDEPPFSDWPDDIPEPPADLRLPDPPINNGDLIESRGNFSPQFDEPLPTKLPPIESEALAHYEDGHLDTAYETALLRAGDDLKPLKSPRAIKEFLASSGPLGGFKAAGERSNEMGGTSSAAAAVMQRVGEMQSANTNDETQPLPELGENPSEAELIAYAEAHPIVRKAMRIFRARVVEVTKA